MYIPFARKYRPRFFREVIGQEVPVKVLRNAVKEGRLANAYLFAGPRGVGKTTLARILAKALNCLKPSEGEPCGECENCKEIDRGHFPDLVEMDAASNRGIDDIRAIREAVSYTPIKGKFKVYIIDEAHMLTREAFNALLKTLEEPPPRTLFILCTTEYEKIPPTILSRCQRLLFSSVSTDEVVDYLKGICSSEGIDFEEEALRNIAILSEGCMRDAASLLDQASIFGDGRITSEVVEKFIGVLSPGKVRDFLRLLVQSKIDEAIRFLNELYKKGYNLSRFWESLEEELRNAILVKSLKDPAGIIENPQDYEEFKEVPLEALLYLENVVSRGRVEARVRPALKAYELAIIKTTIVKEILPLSEALKGAPKNIPEVAEENVEGRIRKLVSPLAYKALQSSERKELDGKLVFRMDEDTYRTFKEEFDRLKESMPMVEFELYKKKEPRENTTSLF